MVKQLAAATLTTLLGLTISALPIVTQQSSAQTTPNDPQYILDLSRAKNLARQAAEKANGGLGRYRAEPSMHGPASQSPFKDNGNGTWTFSFSGTLPGSTTPCYQSVVTVAQQDWRINVDSNTSTCLNP